MTSWIRLDSTMPDHPKVAGLTDPAFRLHVEAICYAARHFTDGALSRGVVRGLKGRPKHVAELVDAGLWDAAEGAGEGWQIHDYLAYQSSAKEGRAARDRLSEMRAAAGRRGAQKRWQNDSKPDDNPIANRKQTAWQKDDYTHTRTRTRSSTEDDPTEIGRSEKINGSLTGVEPLASPASPRERFFAAGSNGARVTALIDEVRLHGQNPSAGFLGQMLKDHGPTDVWDALMEAQAQKAVKVETYMKGVLNGTKQARSGAAKRGARSRTASASDLERARRYAAGEEV